MSATKLLFYAVVMASAAGCLEIAPPGDGFPYASADMKGILSSENWREFNGKVSEVKGGAGIEVGGTPAVPVVSVKFGADGGVASGDELAALKKSVALSQGADAGSYIENRNASPQPMANFNIDGSGVIGKTLTVNGNVGVATFTANLANVMPLSTCVTVAGTNSKGSNGRLELASTRAAAESGDALGDIDFVSANNKGMEKRAASITGALQGQGGANGFGGALAFNVKRDNFGELNEKMRITADGNVGIGLTSPLYKLDVAGHVALRGGDSLIISVSDPGNREQWSIGEGSYQKFTRNELHIATQENKPIKFATNGNLRATIGETGAPYALKVEGDIHAIGSISAGGPVCCASSRSLKSGIRDLASDEAGAAFAELRALRFVYKANPTEEKLGFIAEDVPDLVAQNDRKSLDPMDFVALLTKVVQEQQNEIREQRKRIDRLEARLGEKR